MLPACKELIGINQTKYSMSMVRFEMVNIIKGRQKIHSKKLDKISSKYTLEHIIRSWSILLLDSIN